MNTKQITAACADELMEQREQSQAFYFRNGFMDTNVYRAYNDITMTIMMRNERQRVGDGMSGMGAFTMQDWNDIIHEL